MPRLRGWCRALTEAEIYAIREEVEKIRQERINNPVIYDPVTTDRDGWTVLLINQQTRERQLNLPDG